MEKGGEMDKLTKNGQGPYSLLWTCEREDLLQIIQLIKPKTIIPIHTENPKEFRKLLKNENYKVILPEEGTIAKL